MKLKSGDKVVITGINYSEDRFDISTETSLYELGFPTEVIIEHFDHTMNSFVFFTPAAWKSAFDMGLWTINGFNYVLSQNSLLKYIL
jgi:hypothetical protein